MQQRWAEIETRKLKDESDRYRCIYFSKLIQQYCEALIQKFSLLEEFSSVFEGYAYVLKRPSLQSV
jgi:hypothetical protein